MRTYPKIPPSRRQTSRHLYDVRASTSAHTPIRPLVVRSSHSFPGASLYFIERRLNLRRHFIMDIAQGLSVFPFVFLLALPVSQLIGDPRWYLISIIPRDAAPQNIWQIHIADSVRPNSRSVVITRLSSYGVVL